LERVIGDSSRCFARTAADRWGVHSVVVRRAMPPAGAGARSRLRRRRVPSQHHAHAGGARGVAGV